VYRRNRRRISAQGGPRGQKIARGGIAGGRFARPALTPPLPSSRPPAQLHSTDNQNQKDKFEAELKKEIKKLQKHRDQVKTWAGNSDIKDKSALAEARRRIERKMEQFKAAERELKTKAFSKEGLARGDSKDPRSQMRDWLNDTTERLGGDMDLWEAEQEEENAKPRKQQDGAHCARLEEKIRRHREHQARLEQCLRCLENDDISPDDVEAIKDCVDDYLERHEEDFDEFEDTEYFYSAVADRLDAVARDVVGAVGGPTAEEDAAAEKAEQERKQREKERAAALAAKAQLAAARGQDVVAGAGSGGAAVAVASVATTPKKADKPGKSQDAKGGEKEKGAPQSPVAVVSPSGTDPPAASSPLSNMASPSAASPGKGAGGPAPAAATVATVTEKAAAISIGGPSSAGAASGPPPGMGAPASSAPGGAAPGADVDRAPAAPGAGAVGALPSAPALPLATPQSAREALEILNSVFSSGIPQPADSEWVKKPRRPQPLLQGMPASYPTTKPPLADSPQLFERLDPEALFFAFYFQPGSYQQYLAAKELKRQSWRYHTKHAAWFQRHECPTEITEEFERGSYVYFDSNIAREDQQDGWCYRVKQDFKIDYASLENQL